MAAKKKNTNKNKMIRLSALLLAGVTVHPATLGAQTLSCPISLAFGQFTTCASTETATVTPGNARNLTGCLSAGGSPFNRAQCNVTVPSLPQQMVLSITATQYNISNGTDQMKVDNFQCRVQGSAGTVTGPCVHTTTANFMLIDIGGTLTIGNPQASGSYSGAFTVNVVFN